MRLAPTVLPFRAISKLPVTKLAQPAAPTVKHGGRAIRRICANVHHEFWPTSSSRSSVCFDLSNSALVKDTHTNFNLYYSQLLDPLISLDHLIFYPTYSSVMYSTLVVPWTQNALGFGSSMSASLRERYLRPDLLVHPS